MTADFPRKTVLFNTFLIVKVLSYIQPLFDCSWSRFHLVTPNYQKRKKRSTVKSSSSVDPLIKPSAITRKRFSQLLYRCVGDHTGGGPEAPLPIPLSTHWWSNEALTQLLHPCVRDETGGNHAPRATLSFYLLTRWWSCRWWHGHTFAFAAQACARAFLIYDVYVACPFVSHIQPIKGFLIITFTVPFAKLRPFSNYESRSS